MSVVRNKMQDYNWFGETPPSHIFPHLLEMIHVPSIKPKHLPNHHFFRAGHFIPTHSHWRLISTAVLWLDVVLRQNAGLEMEGMEGNEQTPY